jgi:hypothetical protein
MHPDLLKANRYLKPDEIALHLEGVEYIILAQPHSNKEHALPIHFTIFLNTHEALPDSVKQPVFEKFCTQYNITKTSDILNTLQAVAFAETNNDRIMPMHLFKPEDQKSIPHTFLHIIDFLGDAQNFKEVKTDGQTGWSYSYSDD